MRTNNFNVYVLIVALILVFVCGAGYVYAKLVRYPQEVAVTGLFWERVIPVETFQALTADSLAGDVPQDAYEVNHYPKRISKTCYRTVYNNGMPSKRSYDCSYTEVRASYRVNRWHWTHDLVERGAVEKERIWPSFIPSGVTGLGETRPMARRERLTVQFNSRKHTFGRDVDEEGWKSYLIGQAFTLEINGMDEPIWDTLKVADKR